MTRCAFLATLAFTAGIFLNGCASTNTFFGKGVPEDIPEHFVWRYERFILESERKTFDGISARIEKMEKDNRPDEEIALLRIERERLIAEFWKIRDTDPSTPENEFKLEIDERIDNISAERFSQETGWPELRFDTNGGYRGDLAHVYLLHGIPRTIDTVSGRSFVDLMLWIYQDPNTDGMYAFLFYKGIGKYILFSIPRYVTRMNPCKAFETIAAQHMRGQPASYGDCTPDLWAIHDELRMAQGKRNGVDGSWFVWALFNFSLDSSTEQNEALSPPDPATTIADESDASISGEAQEFQDKDTEYIFSDYGSFIPVKINVPEFTLTVRLKDLDWIIQENKVYCEIKTRITLEPSDESDTLVFESKKVIIVPRSAYETKNGTRTMYLIPPDLNIPAGTYRVTITMYMRNPVTQKYAAMIFDEVVVE